MPYEGRHACFGRFRRAAILIGLAATGAPCWAAGGADAVDDAFVETPGFCHIESWLVESFHDGALQHLGAGCTPVVIPRLELDTAAERSKDKGPTGWSFQPGLKYTLLARPSSVALGISATALLNQHGHVDGAAVVVPLSISRGRFTSINLNAGWQLTRTIGAPSRSRANWGVQIAQAPAPHIFLIGEVFGVVGQRPGEQGGIRWSPGPERVDIDLRASHGRGPMGEAVTLGFTVRI